MAEVAFELLSQVGSYSECPYVEDLGVEQGLWMAFYITDQLVYEVLRLPATRSNKDPIPPVDVSKYFTKRRKFLGVCLLQ